MDVFAEFYEQLDALPKEERVQLLQQILPPQELFSWTDGTRFVIWKHGLGLFHPRDDPRSQVFRELLTVDQLHTEEETRELRSAVHG